MAPTISSWCSTNLLIQSHFPVCRLHCEIQSKHAKNAHVQVRSTDMNADEFSWYVNDVFVNSRLFVHLAAIWCAMFVLSRWRWLCCAGWSTYVQHMQIYCHCDCQLAPASQQYYLLSHKCLSHFIFLTCSLWGFLRCLGCWWRWCIFIV